MNRNIFSSLLLFAFLFLLGATVCRADAVMPSQRETVLAEFLYHWNRVREKFIAHIADAKDFDIPVGKSEFDWEINWRKQQEYCWGIAKKILEGKPGNDWKTPSPDVIPARDGNALTIERLRKTFPFCRRSKEYFFRDPSSSLVFEEKKWKKESSSSLMGNGYFISDRYLISFQYFPDPEVDSGFYTYWSANFSIDDEKCPDSRIAGPNPVPFEHGKVRDTVFVEVNGEIIPIEFGVYPGEAQMSSKSVNSRWGGPNQKFILVKSLTHQIWADLALRRKINSPSKIFRGDDENDSADSTLQSTCVINFN